MNEWIQTVKAYQRHHNIPYKQALKECGKLKRQGKGIWDKTLNFLFGKNVPKEERLRDKERHIMIKTKNGWRTSNYIGPDTDLLGRLRQGIKPATPSDKVAMRHDIDYSLSRNNNDVKTADLRMINKLNDIQKNKQDYLWNIQVAKKGIQTKRFLEDKLGFPSKWFAESGRDKYSDDDIKLLEENQKQLILDGYGLKGLGLVGLGFNHIPRLDGLNDVRGINSL